MAHLKIIAVTFDGKANSCKTSRL